MSKCPYCGRTAVNRFEDREAMGLFESTVKPWEATAEPTTPARQDFGEWYRSEPIRQPRWESDVLVPFGQSLASGLFLGLAAIPANFYWLHAPWWTPALVCVGVCGLTWVLLLSDHRKLLRRSEKIKGNTANGQGGEHQTVTHEYTVIEERADGSQSWQIMVTLGIEPERLRKFAKSVLAGESTGTNRWTTGKNKEFERGEFEKLRDDLIRRGFAKWSTGKNQGWSLTKKGQSWFKALAAEIE